MYNGEVQLLPLIIISLIIIGIIFKLKNRAEMKPKTKKIFKEVFENLLIVRVIRSAYRFFKNNSKEVDFCEISLTREVSDEK